MKNIMIVFLVAMFLVIPKISNAEISQEDIVRAFSLAEKVYGNALIELGGELKYPRSIGKDGKWEMKTARDWTSGFFPGILWLLYENSGDEKWKAAAQKYTMGLEGERNTEDDHDIGFRIMCSFGNGFRLTADPRYGEVIIDSGKTLVKRYNSKIKAIKSWDWGRERWQYPVIIDNLMNLELLFKTYSLILNDDFLYAAINHASRTMATHVRSDGGSYHVVDFNPQTGQPIKKMTHQGLHDESTWARGQAWGIYGFTIAYRETGNPIFLEAALKMLAYDMLRTPEDFVPYWDYDLIDHKSIDKDTSAAAIKAAGLLELDKLSGVPKDIRFKLRSYAEQTLKSLLNNYLATDEKTGVLASAIGNRPVGDEIGVSLIYADYYFLKALTLLKK